MIREVMQTLIEETKRAANDVIKALLKKKQHNDKYNCTIMHKGTEDIISGSQWQLPYDVEIKHVKLVNFNKIIKKLHRSEGHSVN